MPCLIVRQIYVPVMASEAGSPSAAVGGGRGGRLEWWRYGCVGGCSAQLRSRKNCDGARVPEGSNALRAHVIGHQKQKGKVLPSARG